MEEKVGFKSPKIPEMTIRRLSIYIRCLNQLEEDNVKTISSKEFAERFGLNSAQVRKDLAYFGEFGIRGIGYSVSSLKSETQKILGLNRAWGVALIGLGNLGTALFHFKGFPKQGFKISAIFDIDPHKIGKYYDGVPIFSLDDLPKEVRERNLQIGIIAVPSEAAQNVAEKLAAAGIKAVLNFAPARVKIPGEVRLKNVDLTIELESLSYFLSSGSK